LVDGFGDPSFTVCSCERSTAKKLLSPGDLVLGGWSVVL
jgi:hypothetical protein